MSQLRHLRILLVLMLAVPFSGYAASYVKAAASEQAASIPTYQWQFLSASEKAAVDASSGVIMSQRMKNITLNIADNSAVPYTGTVRVRQDSTSFIHAAGWPESGYGLPTFWAEYLALSPSRTYTIIADWSAEEFVRGTFDFSDLDNEYGWAARMTNFHLNIGPDYAMGHIPGWAKTLDYDSLKSAITEYDEALVTHFKGRIQYYELWWEVNGQGQRNNFMPLEHIIGIINTEALTVRSIDPSARICIDLVDNLSPTEPSRGHWMIEDFVKQLLAAGVPFDVIGDETEYANYWAGTGIDTLYDRLNAIAKFGKPIYVWEDGLGSSTDPECLQDRSDTWHGAPPSEDEQAEYMVAEMLVYLGNPSVLGIHWVELQDYSFDHCHCGVISYPDGSRKKSFYALEQLWNSLMVNETVQSINGVASFRGLAGDYSVSAEGYEAEPSAVHVSEEKPNTFSLVLTRLGGLRDQASQLLMKVGLNLTAVFVNPGEIFVIYKSPDARNLLNQSLGEYHAAQQLYDSKDYAGALQHAQKAQDLYDQAQLVENQYRQQQSTATANKTFAASGTVTANRTITMPTPSPRPIQNPLLFPAGVLGIAIVLAAIILRRRKYISQKREPPASAAISDSSGIS